VFVMRHGETAWTVSGRHGRQCRFVCARTRVLVARWSGLPPGAGQHFLLDTGTLSVLSYYKETDSPPQLDSDDGAMTYERFICCGSAKPVANYYELPAVRAWNGPLPTTG
jgi:broad specificity phosphatase PhoE